MIDLITKLPKTDVLNINKEFAGTDYRHLRFTGLQTREDVVQALSVDTESKHVALDWDWFISLPAKLLGTNSVMLDLANTKDVHVAIHTESDEFSEHVMERCGGYENDVPSYVYNSDNSLFEFVHKLPLWLETEAAKFLGLS